jgi:hypothetical protein
LIFVFLLIPCYILIGSAFMQIFIPLVLPQKLEFEGRPFFGKVGLLSPITTSPLLV